MHIRESFDLPGLASPDAVMRACAEPPRQMTLAGLRFDIVVRISLWIVGLVLVSSVLQQLLEQVFVDNSLLAWGTIVGILPLVLIWFPWFLTHGLYQRYKSFEKCRKIYENGVLAQGNVVMMSLVCGNDYACYYDHPK